MNKAEVVNKLTRSVYKAGFMFKKHSPEILVVTGIVGVVTSAVMACKATTKLSAVMGEYEKSIDEIDCYVKAKGYSEEYNEEDHEKDLTIVKIQSGLKVVKLYTPSVGLGVLSIGAILAGNNILRQRNIALAAVYSATDKAFKEYRKSVIDRFGEDLDREIKYNIKTKEIKETIVNEDGSETVVTRTVETVDPLSLYSPYAKYFDGTNCNFFDNDPEFNLMFLRNQQNYANDKLKAKGYMFLNEVYDMLGIPRTQAGQQVGWIYDEKNNENGDNYIDFGIYNNAIDANMRFLNGDEKGIILDFNVDGYILDIL